MHKTVRLAKAAAFGLAVGVAGAAARPGHAAFIQPSSAVGSSEFTAGFNAAAVNTIDGSGLPAGFGPDTVHAAYASGNHWTTATGTTPLSQFITWGFSAPQTLEAMYVWNHRSTPPPATNSGYDVTLFDLTLFDASDNVLLVLNDQALAPDTATAQTVSFGRPVAGVSRVRFDIEGVQSSTTFTGLAEVGFDAVAAAPEPGSVALLGLGLLGGTIPLRARRQRPR